MTTSSRSKNPAANNWLLITGVVVLAILGLVVGNILVPGSEFGGSDEKAEEVITAINPDVEPWFEPFWKPPGGEMESLLFALQAALGAGIVGYVIGLKRGQKKAEKHPDLTLRVRSDDFDCKTGIG